MAPTIEHELRDAMLHTTASNGPGGDGIPYRILHLAFPQMLPLLLPSYNLCMISGQHLEALKTISRQRHTRRWRF